MTIKIAITMIIILGLAWGGLILGVLRLISLDKLDKVD